MNWIQLLNDQRQGEKKKKVEGSRSRFEQDYDRIIFSHPFRMLQDKTQVFPLPKQDFVHTRLTHSLEVASVGRSLGKLAGERLMERYPEISVRGISSHDFGAIVSAASLMHDLGNPPFGHAGESAISNFFLTHEQAQPIKTIVNEKEWSDLTNFEGNAQGFRLVNKRNYQGLSLTYATLGAFTKYPRESKLTFTETGRKSQKKYGFFQCNSTVFREMAVEMGLVKLSGNEDLSWGRHPLAFLVEAADDVCYNIIDLEDGTNLGLVSMDVTKKLLVKIIGDSFDEAKFNRISNRKEKISVLRAMTIQELIRQCVDKFMEVESQLIDGSFDRALTDHIPAAEALKEIQHISFKKIYKSRQVIEREIAGFKVLEGLLESFVPVVLRLADKRKLGWHESSLLKILPIEISEEMQQDTSLYEKLLVLLDFVSGVTDSYALSLYRNIHGISLPER